MPWSSSKQLRSAVETELSVDDIFRTFLRSKTMGRDGKDRAGNVRKAASKHGSKQLKTLLQKQRRVHPFFYSTENTVVSREESASSQSPTASRGAEEVETHN